MSYGPGWFWAACQHLPDDTTLTPLDQSTHLVEQATERLAHLTIRDGAVADAANLPFPDQGFDVVIAMHMLYHLPDPAIALSEMLRVLVPGGRCIVTTNNPRDLPQIAELPRQAFGSAIDDMVQERFGTLVASDLMRQHFSDVTQDTCEDLYQVDDPAPVIDMLLTKPPGDMSDADGKARLRRAARELVAHHGGCVPMPRVQDMISGARAALQAVAPRTRELAFVCNHTLPGVMHPAISRPQSIGKEHRMLTLKSGHWPPFAL